jgi:hypothetical protein
MYYGYLSFDNTLTSTLIIFNIVATGSWSDMVFLVNFKN